MGDALKKWEAAKAAAALMEEAGAVRPMVTLFLSVQEVRDLAWHEGRVAHEHQMLGEAGRQTRIVVLDICVGSALVFAQGSEPLSERSAA